MNSNMYDKIQEEITRRMVKDEISFEKAEELSDILTANYVMEDSNMLRDKDLEFRLSEWKRNTNKNILFITGLSGSGKSTIARNLSKENDAIIIEIDLLEHNDILFDKNVHQDEGNVIIKQFLIKNYNGPHKWHISKYPMEYVNALDKLIDYIVKYAKSHKSELFIVEGIQLMDSEKGRPVYLDILEKFPCIITGTGILKSIYCAYKRSKNENDPNMPKLDSFKAVKEYIGFYFDMKKHKNDLVNKLKK